MNRRGRTTYIAIALLASLLFSGCQSVDREEQTRLRDEGMAAMAAGNYEQAEQDFKDAIQLSNGHVAEPEIDLTYYLGACYFAERRYEDAVSIYDNLLIYNENDADAYFLRGSVQLKLARGKKALSDYKKATAVSPEDYALYIAIYENLKANGKKKAGSDFLNKALEIEGEEAENFFYRGRIYELLGRGEMAETAYTRAMEGGGYDEAAVYLVKGYMEKGKTKKAKEVASFYTNKDDPDVEESVLIGELLLATGDYEKAKEVYEAALAKEAEAKKKNPSAEMALKKGQIAAVEYTGDFEEALSLVKAYLAEYPSDQSVVREASFLETR